MRSFFLLPNNSIIPLFALLLGLVVADKREVAPEGSYCFSSPGGLGMPTSSLANEVAFYAPSRPVGDAAKSAYKHFYLGSHYFSEGLLPRASHYFRQAYQAMPAQATFGLAYALCLGETGKAASGLAVLEQVSQRLSPGQHDYAEQRLKWQYTTAIVASRAGRRDQAKQAIRQAIAAQEYLDSSQYARLSAMYNLAGYLAVMQQESATAHAGLAAHIHVDLQDLERAFPFFEQAAALDSSRQDAQQNLAFLADTLGRSAAVVPKAKPIKHSLRKRPPLNMQFYPHLPDFAEELLAFGDYDELLFLLDISGSMVMEEVACTATDRFTIMREVVLYMIDGLADSTQAGLATIGGNCEEAPKWWVSTDSLNRSKLRWEVQYINPNGTTPLLTTLVKTPTLFREKESRKGIFFVSDGENVCKMAQLDLCEWAASLASRQITLNVLTFLDRGVGNSGAFAEYACLAERSGGQIRYLDPIACSVRPLALDWMDQIAFVLPPLERVACRRGQQTPLWAVFE